jgi:hypothetical protein
MPEKKHNPFKLKDFLGVNPDLIARLEAIEVKNTTQMLMAGQSAEKRKELAKKADVTLASVLELVKLSDLARLPGVKGIRARLYYDAGVDTIEKMAAWEPEALLARTTEFVKATGFTGIAPLPKEVSSTIINAKNLPQVVEWEATD